MECAATIPVKYRGQVGGFSPYMYCTCSEAVMAGREVYGYPKRLAEIEWIETPQAICAELRDSTEVLMSASFIPEETEPKNTGILRELQRMTESRLIYKTFPSAVGGEPELGQVIFRNPARKSSQMTWGRGFVKMNQVENHFIKEIGVEHVLGAGFSISSYGGGASVEERRIL